MFFDEYWLDGKLIERKLFLEVWKEKVESAMDSFRMKMKCKIAFYLLDGVGDPCPYCNKLIDIGKWKKMFEDEGPTDDPSKK